MSDRRLLHRSPLGVTEYYVPTNDDQFVIQHVQDVEPLLDQNKADFNMVTNSDRWGDGKMVARIPEIIANEWWRKGYFRDEAKIKALLNDSDNRFMRIWPGHL
ncbi:hypothetical protein [Mesorhizobium sp. A556]